MSKKQLKEIVDLLQSINQKLNDLDSRVSKLESSNFSKQVTIPSTPLSKLKSKTIELTDDIKQKIEECIDYIIAYGRTLGY